MAQFEFFPLFVKGVNVAEINGYTVDSKKNGERQMGAGEVLGISTGIPTVDIKATSVTPVSGHSLNLKAIHDSGGEVGIGYQYNGSFYMAPFKLMEMSVKTESKNGATTGDFTFMNSGPETKVA